MSKLGLWFHLVGFMEVYMVSDSHFLVVYVIIMTQAHLYLAILIHNLILLHLANE